MKIKVIGLFIVLIFLTLVPAQDINLETAELQNQINIIKDLANNNFDSFPNLISPNARENLFNEIKNNIENEEINYRKLEVASYEIIDNGGNSRYC